MNNTNVGVIVARMHVATPHEAHMHIIHTALNQCDRIIIFLGTTVVKDSDRNPLDFRTRELMIATAIGDEDRDRVVIMPIADCHDDQLWSDELDRRIKEVDPMGSIRLYAGRASFLSHYKGKHKAIAISEIDGISGTEIRKQICAVPRDSEDFRAGIIYAKGNQWPKVHVAVDLAITQTLEWETAVLLGKKHGETKWRLIGGFVDPTDSNFEEAARREGREESGGKYNAAAGLEGGAIVGPLTYINSYRIDDWRYRAERNKIMTTFFTAEYVSGDISASDDLEVLEWISLHAIVKDINIIGTGHQQLLKDLIKKLIK